MLQGNKGRTGTHHCPMRSKGNCRRASGICATHQTWCSEHTVKHLKTEPCSICLEQEWEAKRIAKEDEEKNKREEAAKGKEKREKKHKKN
ncbi:hypothetical protein F5Y11DRAFT_364721 [Daldinia sp. FL1419]|nr:hypothetical protein F5Y11DRAFT_364721 [Daldinia sp. FL1419]